MPENSTALNDAHLKMKHLVVFCPFLCVCVFLLTIDSLILYTTKRSTHILYACRLLIYENRGICANLSLTDMVPWTDALFL